MDATRNTRPSDLDRIEAFVNWCREHVAIPPADLLYGAAGAVENLRRREEVTNERNAA